MRHHYCILALALLVVLSACHKKAPETEGEFYKLRATIEVAGRQGIACDGTYYYVSGSTALYKYDLQGKLLLSNETPFDTLQTLTPEGELPPNHIGDIDVDGENIYAGIENFMDGHGENIQVAVYDAKTLQYKYSIPWDSTSGQVEVCGLAVDREHDRVWMADWVQGQDVYCYDLETKQYIGKVGLFPIPRLQQGIFCKDGRLIISCDDGDAEKEEFDNLYVADVYLNAESDSIAEKSMPHLWRKMNDFKRVGEIEGLTFNPKNGDLIVLANRGARIILGMPKGFYEGYNHEIHEIYVYDKPQEK